MTTPLEVLLADTGLRLHSGDPQLALTGITADSREVEPGFLFVATRGLTVDGHDFIAKAIESGASAVLAEADYDIPEGVRQNTSWVLAEDTARQLGPLAASFYEHPSQEVEVVGVTGTNGKTTVATLCHDLFVALGYRCGLIGTVETRIAGEVLDSTHTTPSAVAVQRLLRQMADAGCGYVFMEVSSHALVQHRTAGVQFAGGAFTNISHDHLDYHGDMKSYIAAKKLLFDGLRKSAFALVNVDDKRGQVMLQNTAARKRTYALKNVADYRARVLDDNLRGLHLVVEGQELYTKIAGHFNAYNLLCAYGIGVELEQESTEVLAALSALPGAVGRLEVVSVERLGLLGVVDYAHTPDALANVLETLQSVRRRGSQLITVFGCGGDRDAAKRPRMGAIAAANSDQVVVTDDNPRSEEPDAIREEILAGIDQDGRARTIDIAGREQAIRVAVRMARDEDVILVAGKGHETYQEVKGERKPFDDREVLRRALRDAR